MASVRYTHGVTSPWPVAGFRVPRTTKEASRGKGERHSKEPAMEKASGTCDAKWKWIPRFGETFIM